jgi:hypothetical protein
MVALYVKRNTDLKNLDKVLNFYKDNGNPTVFMAIDGQNKNPQIDQRKFAVINVYHIKFFDGYVLFFDPQDLADNIGMPYKKQLVVSKEGIPKLDKDYIKNTELLIDQGAKIRRAKNAEIKSILR